MICPLGPFLYPICKKKVEFSIAFVFYFFCSILFFISSFKSLGSNYNSLITQMLRELLLVATIGKGYKNWQCYRFSKASHSGIGGNMGADNAGYLI